MAYATQQLLAVLVAVVLIIIFLYGSNRESFLSSRWTEIKDIAHGYPYGYSLAIADPVEVGMNRMYSTAEVDPLITGQLYSGARAAGSGKRWIYGGRTSYGDKWGMHEFSTGVPGEAGVDVGLLGMREYSLDGKPDVFDDGIPPQWQLPSTPVNWYVPQFRDYYDVESGGPAVFKPHLMSLQEPDHSPLMS